MADRGPVKLREAQIKALIELYKQTYLRLTTTIVDSSTAGKIRTAQTMATIKAQLAELGVEGDKWIKREISQYYLDGANSAIQDLRELGVKTSVTKGLLPINKEAIATLVDATSASFGEGIAGVSRNSRRLLSEALKQQINFTIAEGQLTGEALKTIRDSITSKIEAQGLSALIDRSGKQWQFDTYAEMLVRTKAVEARNKGLTDKMLQNGYDLVQVTNHNSSHAECAEWEGEVLSITGKTPGYRTVAEAENSGLFHPNCQHAMNAVEPDLASKTSAYDNPFNEEDVDTF